MHWLSAQDLDEIRRYNLDFVLQFTNGQVDGELLDVPRYGIWSFRHGDPEKYQGGPPGFWEIVNRDPVTGAVLQRCSKGLETGVILRRGYFKTISHSYPRSRDNVQMGSSDWPREVCRDIRRGQADYIDDAPLTTTAPVYQLPSNLEVLRFGLASGKAWLQNKMEWLFFQQQWNVGVIDAPIHQVVDLTGSYQPGNISVAMARTVRWLPARRDRFLADPFAVAQHNGVDVKMTLLAEEYEWKRERGRIVSMASQDGKSFDPPRPAIELPCHMSYPFLFRHEDAYYCIPETNEAREVSLFRAGSSLRDWTKVATLMQGFPAVDSTVFRYHDRWWLFCTSQDSGANNTLFAWHANELIGPWLPHSANPIKTDICSSRPAGTPFVHDGQLYRPAQDCSTGYGAAVVINRIRVLTSEDFSEEVVAVLKPDPSGPFPNGLHTVCALEEYTVIDGARRIFVPQAFTALAKRKAHRLRQKLGMRL